MGQDIVWNTKFIRCTIVNHKLLRSVLCCFFLLVNQGVIIGLIIASIHMAHQLNRKPMVRRNEKKGFQWKYGRTDCPLSPRGGGPLLNGYFLEFVPLIIIILSVIIVAVVVVVAFLIVHVVESSVFVSIVVVGIIIDVPVFSIISTYFHVRQIVTSKL